MKPKPLSWRNGAFPALETMAMDLGLHGKLALVSGASRGIGLATANALARKGCALIMVARDEESLTEAADALARSSGVAVDALAADLSIQGAASRLVYRSAQRHGRSPDILINNAGSIPPGDLATLDEETWRRSWDLKVFGFIALARAVYPAMRERGGVIANVIGVAGEMLPAGYMAGATGNAALMAFTRSLGRASRADGIRVVGVNPGPTRTERLENTYRIGAKATLGDEERWRELLEAPPAEPEDIADAITFLVSPRARHISGTILTVDGGGTTR